MFIVIVCAYINGNNRTFENPTLFNIPNVAAPHPANVNGPLNIPSGASGASIANAIQITIGLFGIIPPNTALKYGTHNSATLLNIGIISINPTNGAVSIAPSKNVLLNTSVAALYEVNFPHTASAKKLATKNPTITGIWNPIANTTGINGVSKSNTAFNSEFSDLYRPGPLFFSFC